jgi:hypothetical protein
LIALDVRNLNGCDCKWVDPEGKTLPIPDRARGRTFIVPEDAPDDGSSSGGEDASSRGDAGAGGEDASGGGEDANGGGGGGRRAAPAASVNIYDFLESWDPSRPDDIPWAHMSLSEDSNFTQQRSYHAVAIMFFYIDALAEKFPELNNQLHAGWLAHFKRPMSAANLDRPPLHGDCAYDENESKEYKFSSLQRVMRCQTRNLTKYWPPTRNL